MTSIPEMTNEQLDRMIAERRGWTFVIRNSKGYEWSYWLSPDGLLKTDTISSPTTDPRYAMELLEEMAEQHCFGGISFTKKWKLDYKACHNTYKSVFADTPERAIAEAYAQMKEVVK